MPGPALAAIIPLAVANTASYVALGSGASKSIAFVPAGLGLVETFMIGSLGTPVALGGALAYGGLKLFSLAPFLS